MTTLTAATPTAGSSIGLPSRSRPTQVPPVGITTADVYRVIRQRLLLILLVWFLTIGLTVGFTALMVMYYPIYRSEAYVEVKSVSPRDPLDPLGRAQQNTQQQIEMELKNQALLATSTQVLTDVISDPEVRQTTWYQEALKDEARKSKRLDELLAERIYALPVPDSTLLQITGSWQIPSEVRLLVDRVLTNYLSRVQKLHKSELQSSQDELTGELERAKGALAAKRSEIEKFKGEIGSPGPINQQNESMMTLEALVTQLMVDVNSKETQRKSYEQAAAQGAAITPEIMNLVENDPTVHRLRQQVEAAEQQVAFVKSRYGANHRSVQEAEAFLEAAKGSLREEEAVKRQRYWNEMLETVKRSAQEASTVLLETKEQLADARAEQRDRDKKFAELESMIEEKDMLRLNFDQIKLRLDDVKRVLGSERIVQVTRYQDPSEPKFRSSPRWEIWVPAGAMLGLMLSVGLAVFLEVADNSVRAPRDILRHTAIPVLGTIPTSDDEDIEIERVETASIDAPHSLIAESFRQLRANLFFSSPAEQQGVLLVTSPSGGNGKTTVATNLAISIALSGRRVLLIDANFRRPSIPRLFPHVREEGLSNILIGQSRLGDLVTATSVPGLDILGAGPTPPNPAELLGSSYLRDVVVDARSQYDQVIFDGPPILLVSDAVVLAGAVDGVIVVCQYKQTSRGALQRARSQIESINARIFGAVLNMVEVRAGGYYREQYRELREYQEPEEGRALPGRAAPLAAEAPASEDDDEPSAGGRSPRRASSAGVSVVDEEPEPDDANDDTYAATTRRAGSGSMHDLGDIRIDERHDLGDAIEPEPASGFDVGPDPLPRPSAEYGPTPIVLEEDDLNDEGSLDLLAADDDFHIESDLGLGSGEIHMEDDLQMDDDLRIEDEPDDLGDGGFQGPRGKA